MFSRGNISEKIRFSKFSVLNEIIVDMFAGIGYWVLQLSKKKPPAKIYCVDINPNAIEVRAHRSHQKFTVISYLIQIHSLGKSIKIKCSIEQKG